MIDKQARYLESHEWAKKIDESTVTAGLSEHAIEQLGDIVYIEMPAVGTEVTKGQSYGIIESVKAAADLYAPVSGKVIEANSEIVDNPDILKTDAYEKGWFIKIELSDPQQLDTLMDAVAYEEFLKTQDQQNTLFKLYHKVAENVF